MTHLVDVETLARREGFAISTVIKQDYDNHVYVVEHQGRTRVLKAITGAHLRPNLVRDIAYSSLVASLTSAGGDWVIRASAPVATGESWLLRDYLPADPLLGADAVDRPEALRRLGAALTDLDRLAPHPTGRPPSYRDEAGQPVADDGRRLAELNRWVSELAEQDALGPLDEDLLRRRLTDDRPLVQPGFEVWDVKLEDFLDLPDGHVGVYDLEFAYLFGRRHYDAARLYSSLAVPLGAPGPAAVLLQAYLDGMSSSPDVIAPALLPVLTETLLAELYDASLVQSTERRQRAEWQLDRCLAGGLDAVLARRPPGVSTLSQPPRGKGG